MHFVCILEIHCSDKIYVQYVLFSIIIPAECVQYTICRYIIHFAVMTCNQLKAAFIIYFIIVLISQAYGHDAGYNLHEMSQSDTHRKMELCQEVLKILDILSPGYSTSRGKVHLFPAFLFILLIFSYFFQAAFYMKFKQQKFFYRETFSNRENVRKL